MSKRKGQTNGSTTRNQTTPAASKNAPEIDTAGAPRSADGAPLDTASIVDGSNGVDGAADGKGVSDGSENASAGSSTNAHSGDAGHNVSGDIGTGFGSGSIENDGDASADGAAHDGKNGSVSGETDDQAGSVGGGDTSSSADGEGNSGHSEDANDDQGAARTSSNSLPRAEPDVSPDLKAALELAGCDTAENLIDMARIGSNVMEAINDVRKLDGPFKDWAPMDDPAEIVYDLYNALEHAREKAATPALDPEVHCCPICDVPFKADDVCATDIEEGTCHAECLAGSPVVDLNTGEPKTGPVDTFLYSDWAASDTASETGDRPWWVTAPNFSKDIDPREISHSFAYDVFRGVHGSVETAGVVINGGSPGGEPSISFEAVSELVELVRRIGPRATPDVLAQHLVITKHRQSAELTKAEELALKAFAAILIDLDDYAVAERKRLEELAAEKPTPRPVPIDETNMELVDSPMATH
ncbi:MAG TPA: hypothetical protein DCW88_21990 [Agrobacterium sp.]|uniref:hypothetical protein n=1 Tax=Agrobacterium pusense TaxID=648995 RepID=UPI000E9A7F30|nr:hypothetical protein [Agrobacterium sp.]